MYQWLNPRYFLIRINREQQAARRSRTKEGLVIHHQTAFMRFNMQHGEILQIGRDAQATLPQARAGDVLIFSHLIEGSLEAPDPTDEYGVYDNVRYIMHQDDTYTYYLVPHELAYGVHKVGEDIDDGVHPIIYMNPLYAFATLDGGEADNRREVRRPSGLILFENYKKTDEELRAEAARLKQEAEWFAENDLTILENRRAYEEKEKEMAALSAKINHKRFATFDLQYISQRFWRDCGFALNPAITEEFQILYSIIGAEESSGDPLVTKVEYLGREYYLLHTEFIALLRPRQKAVAL
jgi:hypothetical protein